MTCCLVIVKDERRERDEEGKGRDEPPESNSSSEGNRSAILSMMGCWSGCFDDGLESQSVSGQASATAFAVIGRYPF